MSGINLLEMDASDMLDVLHFYFEQETAFLTAEQSEEMTRIRKRLYENLYEREYKYGHATNDAEFRKKALLSGAAYEVDEDDDMSDLQPFDPARSKNEHKPFVPATEFDPDSDDPFGGVLDAPMR